MVFSDFRLSTLSDIRMSSSGSGIFRVRLLETTGAVEVDKLGFGGGRSCISISGLGFTGGGGFMGSVSIGVRCTSDHPSLSRCQFCSSSVLSLSSVSRVMRTLLLFFNLMGFLASVFARGVFSVVDGRGGGRSLK